MIIVKTPEQKNSAASKLQLLVSETPSGKNTIDIVVERPGTMSTVISNSNAQESESPPEFRTESPKTAREKIIEQYREMEVEIKQANPGDNQALEDAKKLESQGDLTQGGEPLTHTSITTLNFNNMLEKKFPF